MKSYSTTFLSQAPWPVNLVIDAASQKQYNDVFQFLLHLKRAKWSLDDLRFKGKLKLIKAILDALFFFLSGCK